MTWVYCNIVTSIVSFITPVSFLLSRKHSSEFKHLFVFQYLFSGQVSIYNTCSESILKVLFMLDLALVSLLLIWDRHLPIAVFPLIHGLTKNCSKSTVMREAYLGSCQTSTMELFCDNTSPLKTANHFWKKALSQMFPRPRA